MTIRKLESRDWPYVAQIYRQGIATKNATFETDASSWDAWNKNHLDICRFVACINDEVIGWIALSHVSQREVYKGVCGVSIYVSAEHSGKGVGKKLFDKLIKESEKNGIWTLYSSIFPENIASIKLHKSCGFREIGYMVKVGKLDGKWRDTVIFERRSKLI